MAFILHAIFQKKCINTEDSSRKEQEFECLRYLIT